MQKSFEVLCQLQGIGLIFSLVGSGGLKVEPKDKITDHARVLIRTHKEGIVTHLNLSAKSAGHAVGDPTEALRGARLTDLKKPCSPSNRWCGIACYMSNLSLCREKGKPSAAAIVWLLEHRQELKGFGWAAGELWRRNRSKRGLAWMLVWNRPGLQVDLTENGVVQFVFPSTRGTVMQTTRPRKTFTDGVQQ